MLRLTHSVYLLLQSISYGILASYIGACMRLPAVPITSLGYCILVLAVILTLLLTQFPELDGEDFHFDDNGWVYDPGYYLGWRLLNRYYTGANRWTQDTMFGPISVAGEVIDRALFVRQWIDECKHARIRMNAHEPPSFALEILRRAETLASGDSEQSQRATFVIAVRRLEEELADDYGYQLTFGSELGLLAFNLSDESDDNTDDNHADKGDVSADEAA